MANKKKIVFVLGAGFTRSFVKDAPLLKDKFSFDLLLRKFNARDFPYAHHILQMEEAKQQGNDEKVDLERLMTRLDGSMPYDYANRSLKELDLLYRDIKFDFFQKFTNARAEQGDNLPPALLAFADACVSHSIPCITFNYDDFLDQALYEIRKPLGQSASTSFPPDTYLNQWNLLHGYGFYCEPAESCVYSGGLGAPDSSMFILKLHGSLNWRLKLGTPSPPPLNSVVHFEKWTYSNPSAKYLNTIERHLEPLQALILPVLFKSAITQSPVFRMVWTQAYEELKNATQVYFIGYSFPATDIAARTLFDETLQRSPFPVISIVNYAEEGNAQQQAAVKAAYRAVFTNLQDDQFYFGGASNWVETQLPKLISSLNNQG